MRRAVSPRKLVHLVSALFILLTLVILYRTTLRPGRSYNLARMASPDSPLVLERVVHLDFKGGAPRMQLLSNLMPLLASAGATHVLIEYEDIFPYDENLRNLSSRSAWSPSDVRQFVEEVHRAGMGVIPLVPTLSHLEFALKLPEYYELREDLEYPDTACPNAPAVRVLVAEMLRQVLELHPHSTSVHLGFDEARLSSTCPRCGLNDKESVLISYLKWLATEVSSLRPKIRIFIWDDMFRSWPLDSLLNEAELWKVVQPIVWTYSPDVTIEVPTRTWLTYQRAFPSLWVASAFMGADGETAVVPVVKDRWQNHASWLRRVLASLITAKSSESQLTSGGSKSFSSIRGVVLTGWTRYDHFGPLCENLPLGIPSLILMLAMMTLATPSTPVPEDLAATRWKELMGCPGNIAPPIEMILDQDPWLWSAAECSFDGADLMYSVKRLLDLRVKVDELEYEWRCRRGWLSESSVARNWTSTVRLDVPLLKAEELIQLIEAVRSELNEHLSFFFGQDVVAEWIYQNVNPVQARCQKIIVDAKALRRKRDWPRGPAPLPEGIEAFNFRFQC